MGVLKPQNPHMRYDFYKIVPHMWVFTGPKTFGFGDMRYDF